MTVRIDVVIMAHRKRERFIPELQAKLDRPARVVWDRRNDRWDTGRRAWLTVDRSASHGLVLQDDAIIPRDLVAGVEKALQHVPGPTPLCLYCGKVQPYRDLVKQLVARTDSATSWLTMGNLNWGPGIVLPTEFIDDMIAWGDGRPDVANYDKRISRWLGHQGIRTWYPWPSLVDHRDSPSLVPGRTAIRRAHRFIGETASALDVDWSGGVVSIPALNVTENAHAHPQQRWSGGTPVKFVSLKYLNLDLSNKAGLAGVRFRAGVAEVTRSNAVSILQSPYWQRRGIRLATKETLAALAGVVAGPPAEPDPAPPPPAGSAVGAPGELSEPATTPAEPDWDVPDGTAADVLAWVGDDPQRARQALDAEQERDKPRTSLASKLERLTTVDLTPHSVQVGQTATEV